MSTAVDPRWVVTTAVERVTPDDRGRAEFTVTVTNLHGSARRASLAIVTEDEAATPWFTVTDAEREIEAGASVPFVITVAVPPDAPSAEYAFCACVRRSGTDEEGVRSNRVLLAVPPPERARRRPRATMLVAIAVVVALAVFVTVGAVILSRGDEPPPLAEPTPTATAEARITVPNVLGATDEAAIVATLTEAGLVPVIRYLYRAEGGGAVDQSPGPLAQALRGEVVEVTFAVVISAPTNVTVEIQPRPDPVGVRDYPLTAVDVELGWEQAEEFVTSWQVMFFSHYCQAGEHADYLAAGVGVTHTTRYRTIRIFEESWTFQLGSANCPDAPEAAYIVALDDFGNWGPASGLIPLEIRKRNP